VKNKSISAIIPVIFLICTCTPACSVDAHSRLKESGGRFTAEEVESIEKLRKVNKLIASGSKLSAEEAESLENQIEQNPHNVILRTKLLGYFFGKTIHNKSAREAKHKNVLWLIENSPESEVLGLPYGTIHVFFDQEAYLQGKKAWDCQVKRNPTNLKVLEHSANYLQHHDRKLSIELLQTARSLDMDNPKWPKDLGHMFLLDLIGTSLETKADVAGKALEQFEIAYRLSTDIGRDALLQYLAKMALAAGNPKKAKEYAEKMLCQTSSGWNYGNNIHYANLTLGRIALTLDDLKEAKKRLINAGKTPGSP